LLGYRYRYNNKLIKSKLLTTKNHERKTNRNHLEKKINLKKQFPKKPGDDEIDNTEYKIRMFQEDDLKDIMRIEKDSFANPWSEKMFAALHRINPDGFFVAQDKGAVAGYAVVIIEPIFFRSVFRMRAHLLNLAVDKKCRRQGIATSMINNIIHTAQEFYSFLRFARVGMIKDFYEDGDAIVMSKKIP
jgi:ribosomal-protein-alanine N-acetyltransferase